MRYSPELAARAQAWLAQPLASRRSALGLINLSNLWATVQGLPTAPACRQCQYSDRVHDLTAYLREYARLTSTISSMATADTAPAATYQLKPEYAGQTLTDDSYGKAVTADNLTDEDAEHFIQKGFGHVFQQIGVADSPAPTTSTEVEPAGNPDLVAEQNAHAVTKQALADEKEHGKQVLKAEKDAHKATKKELTEAQKQLADATKQLADLAQAAEQAADKTGGPTA